jgi:superfamily II DNA or RNA helicase
MRDSGIVAKSQSWEQFRSLVATLPTTKAKGDAFEALCAAFLHTDPRYVAELKSVWLRHEVPAATAKRLNLPSSDEGIDGIAQTHGGEFWSFQCKFLSDHKATLTKNDLDGFAHLSFTHCKGITKALVLHTSSAPIRKHKLLGVSEIGLREFEGLDEEAWAAIRVAATSASPRAVTHKPRQPRPHQEAAVAAITAHLKTHDRGRVLMACGSGKSLVGFWVQAAMGARQVVVAVPSLSLLNQTLKEWATEWAARGERVRYTAVCGDESAADIGDSFVEHAYELGIDTYTDESRIAERLKALRGEHHVVFTTYQSSHRLAAAAKRAKHSFDLGILDEAHKTVGERGGRFTTLLHPKVPIRKRIAMTATERVLKGSDDRVLSMDDPKVYGEVAFSYTFKQAIADGVICDYKVITLAVSETRMRELIAANKHLRLHGRGKDDRLRLAQDLAAGELLAKAQSEHGVRHAISFHRSISAASAFADQWESVDRMVKRRVRSTAFHVSSKVPTGRRVELLREFRESASAVITNARCLTEGVDVPNVDAVLFADPRRSTIDIVQAVGRTLRKNPKNPDKIGYVLLPVLVEDGQTVDEFLESSAFKEVGRVLAVLSTHDERIAEEFRAVEVGRKRNLRESRIVFGGDVPVGIRLSAEEFADRCGARVWKRVARVNWRPFAEAREWVRGLELTGETGWWNLCAGRLVGKPPKPADIPAVPSLAYKREGWVDWTDWVSAGWRPFAEARAWTRALGLQRKREWFDYCVGRTSETRTKPVKPSDIPSAPNSVYKGVGWDGWGDWLGVGWRPFSEARAWTRGLGLNGTRDWKDYCAGRLPEMPPKPADVPSDPNRAYKGKGWTNWGDWLGTRWLLFAEARNWVRGLGLRDQAEWKDYCAGRHPAMPPKPADVPSDPNDVYMREGWIGWADWLGTATDSASMRAFRPFAEARAWVRVLGLRGVQDWKKYRAGRLNGKPAKPTDIPNNPEVVYKDRGWIDWRDWHGTDWLPFTEARAWVRALGLQGLRDWQDYCAGRLRGKPPKPMNIPSHPNLVYRGEGWIGYPDWLGTGAIAPKLRTYRPFTEAREWVRGLGLRSWKDWQDYCAGRLAGKPPKPADIPAAAELVYRDAGWSGTRDWLGTDRKPRKPKSRKP